MRNQERLETADVVVVGGGVIGLAIARALAVRGVNRVFLIERAHLGAEASRAAAGMLAPQAAGVIHSDFEKGFIRAEVIRYGDFIKYGSEAACRDNGKLAVQGKDYVVEDGDIMHFRFNV